MAMADTTPSKVYDIAEKLGYEGARTQSSAKAVYACADALGFVGPHARRITDALSDLYTVVSGGGGGGGGDLGALQPTPYIWGTVPTVGAVFMGNAAAISYVSVGDTKVVSSVFGEGGNFSLADTPAIAAGATVAVAMDDSDGTYSSKSYLIEYSTDDGKITSVSEWNGTVTSQTSVIVGYHDLIFTMPALDDGQTLVLVYS